jgi:hypothetical protein
MRPPREARVDRSAREEHTMRTCAICHFSVVPDDWEIVFESGGVLCVDCFHREAGTALPMSKELRKQLEMILNDPAVGQ